MLRGNFSALYFMSSEMQCVCNAVYSFLAVQCAVSSVHFTAVRWVHCVQCIVQRACSVCKVCSVFCSVCSVLCTLCSVLAVWSAQCSLQCSLHCSLQCKASKGIILPCRPICGPTLTVYQQLHIIIITFIIVIVITWVAFNQVRIQGYFCFSSGEVVWECHEHRVMEEALHWSDRFRLRWYYHGGEGGIRV